jgi:hypothetical protein
MVRFILMLLLTHLFLLCASQEKSHEKEIKLNASFSEDSVFIGDSLKLNLYYKNISNSDYILYPKAIIGLVRNMKAFITYESPARISYQLNDICNYDSVIHLKPGEEFKNTFNIRVNRNFFYEGENSVLVYYHFLEKPPIKKRLFGKSKRELILSLRSPPIKIVVIPKE